MVVRVFRRVATAREDLERRWDRRRSRGWTGMEDIDAGRLRVDKDEGAEEEEEDMLLEGFLAVLVVVVALFRAAAAALFMEAERDGGC